MYVGHRYTFFNTLKWSRGQFLMPALLSTVVTGVYASGLTFISIPWLPVSIVGVAVAFYLGFKNNASYDRTWEARKIYGGIVNASRSWAFTARDFVGNLHATEPGTQAELDAARADLVHRLVAWMDALRFQLRKVKSWEHGGKAYDHYRTWANVAEFGVESVEDQLARSISDEEVAEVLGMINPAAHLLANQSRALAQLRAKGWLDDFRHIQLQSLLHELMAQQGKAERIKNFPFPRQYATVNSFFAMAFTVLVPFGMVSEFAALGDGFGVWLTIPFSTLVSWVFLTADKIGDWSENPFEGLANDVPITAMSRGIERDIRQIIGETELPPARQPKDLILM